MFVQKYDFVVNYIPGKDIIHSEILSRARRANPRNIRDRSKFTQLYPAFYQHGKIKTERETLNNKTLHRVASSIAQGRPKLQNQLNPSPVTILEMSLVWSII